MELTVTGMSCGGCEDAVENAVSALDGVTSVTADNESETVVIEGDVDQTNVTETIEDAGYEVV